MSGIKDSKPVLINGTAYHWGQIKLLIEGTWIFVTKIDFKEAQAKENLYSSGYQATERGYGNIEAEGSIAARMNQVESIRDSVVSKSLLAIAPFDITVTWLPDVKAVVPVTKVLRNCEFMEDSFSASQGDTNHVIDLPLAIGEIDHK